MPISWNRITINGAAYTIEASARTEAGARKYAAQMGLRFTRIPGRVKGRDYLILRPAGVQETMDSGPATGGIRDSVEAHA
jgi:hypothetical protein